MILVNVRILTLGYGFGLVLSFNERRLKFKNQIRSFQNDCENQHASSCILMKMSCRIIILSRKVLVYKASV